MNTKIIWIILLAGAAVMMYYALHQAPEQEEAYVARIEKQRKEKDNFMRTAPDSPFAEDSVPFQGLSYYPVNPEYLVKAKLIPAQRKPVTLPTSDGKEKNYLEFAHAEFELLGSTHRLLLYEIMESGPYRGTLFLAFGDATSAAETYGAGRYLDVKKVRGATSVMLDFNESYNPYCAYNDRYSCPLPPRENLLSIAIRAGEMNYGK
jgi:hypothetical protein